MKNICLRFVKFVVAFIGIILIFNICLYFSCTFDSKLLKDNILASHKILESQGEFYELFSPLCIVNNNCTDTVIINEIYSVDSSHPFESYMKVRKNYRQGQTNFESYDMVGEGVSAVFVDNMGRERFGYEDYAPIKELEDFLNEKTHISINYGRYWHGYLTIFRPLLIFFNISQIRNILFLVFLILYAYFLYLLDRRFGHSVAVIFCTSLLCSGYFTAYFSLESSPIFLTAMVSSIIFVKRIDEIKDPSLFIFLVACIVNFIDYLTVPLLSLGLLVSLYTLKLLEDGKDCIYCAKFLIINSVIWLLGYAGTWFCKWALYDLCINDGQSMINIGLCQCFYRMTRQNLHSELYLDKYIYLTVHILGNASLFSLFSLAIVMYIKKFSIAIQGFNKRAIPFFMLATYPAIWYIALANHTILHYIFTYRLSAIYMIGLLLGINELLFGKATDIVKTSNTGIN